ncbi:TRAP-type mannitol/chloroaromatic compound transport system, small permease component [Desulfuromusa kysingii]|uniref:TRAP-type mannitol/chloroaromatic compound transport system, small permease component n=1 Tax=Desulfuromusa kysingii TaxID=37625 RepID=A0A1H3XKI8_9BACT|nr:TRAP transporter small permease subunit [Desulfuromusa kysingii]SDZ99132.1 TRAP-type mannitol/chloroaromatic compound transport system, small permease component [Desulfuromusa kysingii]
MPMFDSTIDTLNEKVGFYSSYLVLPLILVVAWEVIMRYGFNSPTSWAFELTVFLYGIHFSFALAYAHKHNTHVAIDVFESRLAPKSRLLLRITTNIVLFIPTIGLLTFYMCVMAVNSWQQWEHASSSWAPAIYPLKTLMAIGFILFFLQGVAKLTQDIRSLKKSD